ncbi:hypothetical protein G6F68_016142 [Rhizopus microsporus]|nr:hypothetical protein G6F68_016142 [Rhizopus microsporus]
MHEALDADLQSQGSGSAARGGSAYVQRNDEEAVPVIGLRRKIAQKMAESKRRIPHFSYVEEIDVTELEDLRVQLNQKWGESRGKLTLLPLLARAMVVALRDFPQINARYDDEGGVRRRGTPAACRPPDAPRPARRRRTDATRPAAWPAPD